jgi:metallophosphoesterase superfamily enzyme
MLVSFVRGAPALLIRKEKVLVVGDLHIGLDLRYRREGIIFQDATRRMSDRLLALCRDTGARGLVIIGDVKESVAYPGFGEFLELKAFFGALAAAGIRMNIAKGNHDGEMDRVIRNLGLEVGLEKEIFVDGVALMHGNAWPSEGAMRKRYVVCGHMHFAVDSEGKAEKAWLVARPGKGIGDRYKKYNKSIRLIVVPPFNDMILGSAAGRNAGEKVTLFRQGVFDWKDARAYGLDGTLRRLPV